MKRIHFLIILLISFCLFIPFPVSADDAGTGFNSDDDISNIKWSVNSDGSTCTVNGYGQDYWYDPVIPEEINGYKVTDIAPYAFTGIRLRGTLTLPDGLETIGDGSFAAYYDETDTAGSTIGLTGDLIIPDSVKEIGLSSFCYNEFGGRLHLPPGITQIGASTFIHCTFSEDIVIPDSVKTIGDYAFSSGQAGQYLLTGDAKMILGKNIRVISKGAFYWCGKMEDTLILPDTVVSVGWNAFTGCRFDRVIIPPGVASIGESALSSQADSHNAYVLSDDATFLDGYALGNPSHTVIHANPWSTAKDFAAKNGQTFISLAQDGDIHAQAPCTSGHEYSKWYTTKEPTETENGTRTQICLACGSVHNETIVPYVPETPDDPTPDDPTPDDPTPDEPAVTKESQSVALSAKKYSKTTNSSAFNLKASAKTQLTYKSNNTKVAKVSSKGLVTITGPGKATITVTAAESSEYTSAKAKVTVNVALHKPKLTAKNLKGRKIKLSWSQVKYADGYKIYIKGPGDKKYKLRLTKSAKVKSVTHKGLVKGKTYRYKIVAFKKVGGKTYTSAASTIRTVKVKK